MALTIEMNSEIETKLHQEAERLGVPADRFILDLLEKELKPKEFDLTAFLALPRAEQDRIIEAAVEDAAPLYAADLALPVAERELTAFTALDGEDFRDGY